MNLGLYMQISNDSGSHDPDPGPQENSTKKSCVSFETVHRYVCIYIDLKLIDIFCLGHQCIGAEVCIQSTEYSNVTHGVVYNS